MPPQSRITCYTAWANVRCSSLSHQLNNVFTDLFTDIHLKSLLESFTGGSPQKLSSLAQHQTKRQLVLQFKLFLGELQKAGIVPQNCNIDCGLISKKNTKSIDDLLWKLIVHDIQFTWERSSQLQLDSDKLICSVCFKWTPMVKSVLKQTRTPLSFFAGLETTLNEAERSSVSSLIESFSLQDIGPFPGREIAKALNKKIPSKGWNYYPSAVECILDLINTHLQIAAKSCKLHAKDFNGLADSHDWCCLVNSFMPGTFIVELLPADRWTTNLALRTMEAIILTSTSFTSRDLLEADSKALCAYMCVIFMCGYKFRQSIAVINCIRELQQIANLLAA
ncbi:uncharacterized protein LOC132398666 [Hypanus sabinus]|uniref:uncharacterized protein LOC132398666 n=1 Tax=Hypanus sabinus TaxID=79690 RepID=UPI0028C3DE4D|nr:uncharacterized protein LOC132398666 [Hypanus sabinus]